MKKFACIFCFLMGTMVMNAAPPVKKVPQKTTPAEADSTEVIMKKAESGDAAAQNTVGVWYYMGKGTVQKDYSKAIKWWALSAKQDNASAIGNMAMCYQLGRGVEKDSVLAITLYEKAIKKGNAGIIPQHEEIVKNTGSAFSSTLLYECYSKGIGVKRNAKKANEYQEKIAEAGNVEFQYAVALRLLNNKQADEAVTWFKRAAKQGHTGAIYYYGYLVFNGMGIAQDKPKGIQYLELASKKDFVMANYQLGRIYHAGDGVEQDYDKAIGYIIKAAEGRNGDAQWLLGTCYLKGEGVPVNYYFATQWLAEAVAKNHKKQMNELLKADNEGTFSQYLMGLRKYYVDKDYASAVTYFTKVDKAKNMEGKTMLGVCLANKDYSKQNLKKAVKTLTKSSVESPVANYYLATMYETGTGVEKDDAKALELLQKAAEGGVPYAQCKLGDRYMTGTGVAKDFTKAAQLYLKAEAQNYLTPASAKYLAMCYEQKLGVLPDMKNAQKRIESLNSQHANGNLVALLKLLEE